MMAGQELEGEDDAQARVRLAQLAEDELRSRRRSSPGSPVTSVAQPAEQRLARRNPQHEDGEEELQPESPGDHPPADRAPVVREQHADREDQREPDAGPESRLASETARAAAPTRAPRPGPGDRRRRRARPCREAPRCRACARRTPGAPSPPARATRSRGSARSRRSPARCATHGDEGAAQTSGTEDHRASACRCSW